jgi:hypothetical protein
MIDVVPRRHIKGGATRNIWPNGGLLENPAIIANVALFSEVLIEAWMAPERSNDFVTRRFIELLPGDIRYHLVAERIPRMGRNTVKHNKAQQQYPHTQLTEFNGEARCHNIS